MTSTTSITSRLGKIYNHIKDTLDGTEAKFTRQHHTVPDPILPSSFDLRKTTTCVPPILDQGQLGTCAANEISNALRYCVGKVEGMSSEWQPSRLFIYYFTRLSEGSPVDKDTGISIKGGMDAINKYGACNETTWPYDISQYTIKPSDNAVSEAQSHIPGFVYLSVPQNLVHLKQALVSGFPVVIGIQVYESFESEDVAKSGVVPMPDTQTEKNLGGHCVCIYSYDDASQRFTLSNSWSSTWGNQGFFTLPYDFVLNPDLASDFWTVRGFR